MAGGIEISESTAGAPLKRCAKCHEHKPATPEFFSRSQQRKDGLKPYCKECLRVRPEDRVRGSVAFKTEGGVEYKTCTACNQWLPATDAYFYRTGGKLVQSCKECQRAKHGSVLRSSRNDPRDVDGTLSKPCTKCGAMKPATTVFFPVHKDGKLGLHPWCRECVNSYAFDRSLRSGKVKRHHTPPREIDGVLHRQCTSCDRWKPAAAEFFQSNGRGGFITLCRECSRARSVKWAEENSEKAVARASAWIKANQERHYQHLRATLSKRRGAPGSYTADDIVAKLQAQDGRCFYCQVELDSGYHVDHFVALTRGGTNSADNIVIACARCNHRKGSKDPHKFLAQIRKMKSA